MTFFASLVLVFVLVIRPQEIWPALADFRLLEVFTGLVVIGLLVDLAMGKQKHLYFPQLPFLGAFIAISYFTTALALGASRAWLLGMNLALIPAVFTVAVAYGANTLPRLRITMWVILALAAFVSGVAVHQGTMDPECIPTVVDEDLTRVPQVELADGRVCGRSSDCHDETRPDMEWKCERVGLFKTFSAGGRVRWRGQLADPNELSVFLGAILPLLVALGLPIKNAASSHRSAPMQRVLSVFAVIVIALALTSVIMSQSRGGQLVVATVFAVYFVNRFGKKGLVVAAVLALPVILFGGRSDADADVSSNERVELLTEGVSLVIQHPFRGVGVGQFPDQVNSPLHLSAHNSYLLAAAETGFGGFFAWSGVVWMSLKVPIMALRRPALSEELRTIATALVVSFCGIAVGIFFLSFTYKQLLFVWFGLAGGFYGILKQEDPELTVKIGWRDCLGIAGTDLGLIFLLYLYTRTRGGG